MLQDFGALWLFVTVKWDNSYIFTLGYIKIVYVKVKKVKQVKVTLYIHTSSVETIVKYEIKGIKKLTSWYQMV